MFNEKQPNLLESLKGAKNETRVRHITCLVDNCPVCSHLPDVEPVNAAA